MSFIGMPIDMKKVKAMQWKCEPFARQRKDDCDLALPNSRFWWSRVGLDLSLFLAAAPSPYARKERRPSRVNKRSYIAAQTILNSCYHWAFHGEQTYKEDLPNRASKSLLLQTMLDESLTLVRSRAVCTQGARRYWAILYSQNEVNKSVLSS